jgi:ABC-type nitrate/sulfonate/bicarbonate transport system permease component
VTSTETAKARLRWAPTAAGLAVVALLGLLLQLAIAAGLVSGYVVSPPSAVLASLFDLVSEEGVGAAFLLTFGATFAASALAAAVGIPTGYLLYRYPLFGGAYENWIGALFSAPIVLLYPMFLVVFGRSTLVCVAMGFVVGVIPVVLKTREGLLAVRPVLINVARSFGASDAELARKVLLPAARPAIFTGLRLCLIYAMTNIVGIEFLANLDGLGFLVGEMYDRYDIPAMYGAILCLILTSALFYTLTGRLERWLAR